MNSPLPDISELGPLLRHLEACYPNEGCGVILKGPGGFRVVPLENVYDRYHAIDPEQFPRTARTAYLIDPRAWLKLSTEAEGRGEAVSHIVHSHADVGAYFSDEDKAMAAPEGQPLHPGVGYLVVAVNRGRVDNARLFQWASGSYFEVPIELPSSRAS
ncbi:MAG: Mov34/MPN/PAD-1 family protein [Myxococcaceae bacterium]